MSRENPLWDTELIRGELLKLGIIVSKRSIRRYRWRKPAPGGGQTWRTFLSNPAQRDLGRRPLCRTDHGVPGPLRLLLHRPRSSRGPAFQRHREPHRSLGVATTGRGDALGENSP